MFWDKYDPFGKGDESTGDDNEPYTPGAKLQRYAEEYGIELIPEQVPLRLVLDLLGAARWQPRGLDRLDDVATTNAIRKLGSGGFGFVASDHLVIVRDLGTARPQFSALEVRHAGGSGWYMTDCAATEAIESLI